MTDTSFYKSIGFLVGRQIGSIKSAMPGHEFYGNQYVPAGGGSNSSGDGDGQTSSASSVSSAKDKIESRARALGYGKVTYKKGKFGLQVIAKGKPLNLFVAEDGTILDKNGKPHIGYKSSIDWFEL